MPEAPEVANVIAYLKRELKDRAITDVTISHEKLSDNMPAQRMEEELIGQHFRQFHRHGKYLIFELDDKDLVAHLRMEGKFLLLDELPEEEKEKKPIHAVFTLDNGKFLCYRDTRKFGRMQLYDRMDNWRDLPCLKKTGLDVLDPLLTGSWLMKKAGKRALPIKSILLDQSVVAGIGNIYADEILFDARVHPETAGKELTAEQWDRIAKATKDIIQKAMDHGGTTIRTFSYGDRQHGSFQEMLKVHQREGKPCPVCQNPIEKCVVNQRSTYLCPVCQRKKESE